MKYNLIPLTPAPNQNLTCTIPIDDKNITLALGFRYNTIAKYWCMSVSNASTKENILDSIPLITGSYPVADLLSQYGYLGIGSAFIVKVGSTPLDYPDDTNLGTDFILIWGDTNG